MVEILQVRGEAYSSRSENFVNDSDYQRGCEDIESKARAEVQALEEVNAGRAVEKLRMRVDNGEGILFASRAVILNRGEAPVTDLTIGA